MIMDGAPDPNVLIAYLMLAIYCLLAIVYSLEHDDGGLDERSTKSQRNSPPGSTLGARLAGAVLHAGSGIDPVAPAGKSAAGLSAEALVAFMSGARRAYDTIISSYAAGRLEALDGLVADDVLQAFGAAVAQRHCAGEHARRDIVGIREAEIERVDVDAERVEVTVRFLAEQVTALFDAEGVLVAGIPLEVVEAADIWRFARRHDSTSPNWVLVATDSEGTAPCPDAPSLSRRKELNE